MKIPEILTSLSGEQITSTDMWEKYRRNEIYTLFENFVYGVAPGCPRDMRFSVKNIERKHNITQKKADIIFPTFKIIADIFIPTGNTKKLPAYLLCMHQFEEKSCNIDEELDFEIAPILDIVKRGYAVVTMKTSQICPDTEFSNGLTIRSETIHGRLSRHGRGGSAALWTICKRIRILTKPASR